MPKRKRVIKLLKTEYRIGDTVPTSAIYECSDCWNVTAFKHGERFLPCEDCHDVDDDQHWYKTNQVLHFVTKNVNTEFEKMETFGIKASDWVAEFVGSWSFIIFFGVFMAVWMSINVYGWYHTWDPYPFILLNLILSTIAAIQAPLIMMSQNRQAAKSELRAELDYQTNLNTEKQVAEVLAILREMQEEERITGHRVSEVLEEEGELLKRVKPKRRKSKASKIMEDVGIEHVEPVKDEE